MTKIWLVRHAESLAQVGDENWLDSGLSDRGIQQAMRLHEYFKQIHLHQVWISPLVRARETYRLAKLDSLSACYDSRLIEIAEPHHYAEILPYETPDDAEADTQDAWDKSVYERAKLLVDELRGVYNQSICLIGHWGIFSFMLRQFMGVQGEDVLPFPGTDVSTAVMDNAAVSLLIVDHPNSTTRTLRLWNDRHHVADLLSEL